MGTNLFTLRIIAALIISVLLCDLHSYLSYFYPQIYTQEVCVWIDKSHKQPVTIAWYIYDITNILKEAIWCFCFALVAKRISHKLYRVLFVIFLYHITQIIFYIYNRNSSAFSNYIVYIAMIVAVIALLKPEKRQAKIIEL